MLKHVFPPSFGWLMVCLLCVAASGCTRRWWREQADCDVQEMISEKGGYLDRVALAADPDSRLFDPYDPDASPLPPDDPASHELMHNVAGHAGWSHWHDRGDAAAVDAGTWMHSLPWNSNGEVVVDLPAAIRIARKNSRDYQTELENLYLSALDVTFERFRFDAQFFAGNATSATFDGRDRSGNSDSSALEVNSDVTMRRLSATGGELVAGLANSLVWQFSGRDEDLVGSVFNFSLVQPLLRFGGRARVLERLTQSERTLLANVRQMEQFRRGFYIQIVAGRNPGDGPNRQGPVGLNGLGLLAGLPGGRAGAAPVGGFFGVLQEQQQIRNRTANLAALRDSVTQLDAFFQAGRLQSRLQVDQTRQAYYNAQSNLLTARAGYASRLDSFKINLGLPPSVPLIVQDPLINRFNLIDDELTQLLGTVNDVLDQLRAESIPVEEIRLSDRHRELVACEQRILEQLKGTRTDLDRLMEQWPNRAKRLGQLRELIERQKYDVDWQLFDLEMIRQRIDQHEVRLNANRQSCVQLLQAIRDVNSIMLRDKPTESRKTLRNLTTELSGALLDTMLTQASVRLELIDLIPVAVTEQQAIETARTNRLDWMNARASVVDAFRKIEFEGNALQSELNLTVSGDLGTRGDNPIEFNSNNGRLRMGVEFDSPITRLVERNRYRESQIAYQRARRNYMQFEDEISQSLRNTLRIIDLSQINFEIRRTAVLVAISQVTLARFRLNEPLRVGAANTVSPTTARDLVSALNDLLESQNDLLNAWVSFEVLRLLLDFEMGTMQLNQDGLWIDPGSLLWSDRPTE